MCNQCNNINHKQDFVHLHAHTHFSVQDALPSPTKYALKAREMGFPAAAITDHGKMGGVIEFVDACRAPHEKFAPIKPLIGCEVYTCEDRFDKSKDENGGRRKLNHLTLIAQNEVGYKNLLRMTAIGADPDAFHYSPRIDWEVLKAHSEGVIALSGCLASELSQALLKEDRDSASEIVKRFKDVYGERYYIELQYHGIPEQKHNLPLLCEMARKYDVPMVASNDVHYINNDDWQLHDVLIQMRDIREDKGSEKKNGKKEAYGTHQFWLKSEPEMRRIFESNVPESITNTVALAESVEDFLKLDVPHLLPPANVPMNDERFLGFWKSHLPHHKPNEAYLAFLTFEGMKRREHDQNKEYVKRAKYELTQIWNMGVTDYFLIQREMVEFMKSQNIYFGIRGSGVGSLVNYYLEVCSVDPIRWNLMFERFLNPGRGNQYKINYDVLPTSEWKQTSLAEQDQQEAVKRLRKNAKEFLAQNPDLEDRAPDISREIWVLENQGLATYLCDLSDRGITSKTNDSHLWTAYIMGITPEKPDGDMIVKKVATLPDVDTDIDGSRREEVIDWAKDRFGHDRVAQIGTWGTYAAKASVVGSLKTSTKFKERFRDSTHAMALRVSGSIPKRPGITIDEAIMESEDFAYYYGTWKSEIDIAKQLVGTISNLGVHAGGVLVASEPICDHSPIENSKGTLCSGYDMKSVERVGLVKYDYLGLATYEQISIALGLIKNRHGIDIILDEIPLEDPKVFKNIYAKGKTSTVFQFASKGMQEALRMVEASNTEDLIAVAALYRPGPMEYIPQYAEGKKKPEEVRYAHPLIKKNLSVTYGIMVYQEQAMFLARDMAGFDWNEVDKLRKAISKKSGKDFDEACNLFREKSIKRGIPAAAVNEVLGLMSKFGGYAFNRSHACSYAILSYWTAWLRYYYPSEWIAACIQVDRDDADKMAIFSRECRNEGINLCAANVNESGLNTTVNKKGDIMLPLTSIKGVGQKASDIIAHQPFDSLRDMCWRTKANRKMVQSMAEGDALYVFPEINGNSVDEIMEIWDDLVKERVSEEKRIEKEKKMRYKVDSPIQQSHSTAPNTRATRASRPAPSKKKIKGSMNRVFSDEFFGD